jgi:hypothetical protein
MFVPIAVRVLRGLDQSDPVHLEIACPVQSLGDVPEEGLTTGDWVCTYRIRRGTAVFVESRAAGSDSFQAIINAITQLRNRFSGTGLKAAYEEGTLDGTGLPDYLPQGFGYEFEKYLGELVEREVEIRARALVEAHKRVVDSTDEE